MAVIETAQFKLRAGITVEDFLTAHTELDAYISAQPGINADTRRTSVNGDGLWTVSMRWNSAADAEASMTTFQGAPWAQRILELIDTETMTVEWSTEIPAPTSRKADHVHSLCLEGIRDGDIRRAVSTYTGDRYTQHSTGVRDGAEGFIEFFESFTERNPKRDIEIVRTIVDGRYVFVHAAQSLNDGETRWVTMDLFDTDGNEKITEHWDTIAPLRGPNSAGHTQVDGSTKITDLHLTETNKRIVHRLLTESLALEPTAELAEFISAETYIQHNPDAPDGLDGLQALIAAGAESGETLYYEKVHNIVGQGNFVAALSLQVWAGIQYAAFDLFRLEQGMIVEHWDCVEPLPAKEDLVNSGKF